MSNPEVARQPQQTDASVTVHHWVTHCKARQEGHARLPGGNHSPEWINFGKIWEDPMARHDIGGLLMRSPGLIQTDIVIGVPHGGTKWAETIHEMTEVPLVRLLK